MCKKFISSFKKAVKFLRHLKKLQYRAYEVLRSSLEERKKLVRSFQDICYKFIWQFVRIL